MKTFNEKEIISMMDTMPDVAATILGIICIFDSDKFRPIVEKMIELNANGKFTVKQLWNNYKSNLNKLPFVEVTMVDGSVFKYICTRSLEIISHGNYAKVDIEGNIIDTVYSLESMLGDPEVSEASRFDVAAFINDVEYRVAETTYDFRRIVKAVTDEELKENAEK